MAHNIQYPCAYLMTRGMHASFGAGLKRNNTDALLSCVDEEVHQMGGQVWAVWEGDL
jgi:hypothetical protein